jgi:hypothetical protein
MKRLSASIFILLVAVLLGGSVFLATWDIPAPIAPVKKVLPDDRFPR